MVLLVKHVGLLLGNLAEGLYVTDHGGVVGIRSWGGGRGGTCPALAVSSEPPTALEAVLEDVGWQLGIGIVQLIVVHGITIILVHVDSIIIQAVSQTMAG